MISGEVQKRSLAAAALMLYAVVVWMAFLAPVHRSDLLVFLAAGRDVLAGVNPYPGLHTHFLYSGHAFVYPWVAALPFVPLAALSIPAADVVFFLLSIAAVLLAVRWSGAIGWAPYVIVLGAATTIRGLQVGTLNALLLLLCVAAWRFRDRILPVAGAVTAVVVSKIFLAPLLAWLAVTRRWTALVVTAGLTAGALGVGFLLCPFGPRAYLTLLAKLSRHETHTGWSLNRLFLLLGASRGLAQGLVIVVVAILGVVAWRIREDVVLYAAAVVGALLACPIVWSHYLVLAMAPLLVAGVRWEALAGFAALTWLVAPPPGANSIIGDLMGTVVRLTAIQVGLILVFTAVCRTVVPARGLVTSAAWTPWSGW